MLRHRIENLERSMVLEEVQRQERMQEMPLKSVLKIGPKQVNYHNHQDYSSSDSANTEGEHDSEDGSEGSESDSDSRLE